MDELLQQFGKTLQELQQFVSSVAPDVWGLYLKQTMIDAWICVIVGLLFFITTSVLLGIGIKKRDEGDWLGGAISGAAFTFFLGILCFLVEGLRVLINPQYFAMQDLLGIIK